jgi:histidinol dehydrogenase
MEFERLVCAGEPDRVAADLRSLVPAPESVSRAVAKIIADVRAGGDQALLEYTRRFDLAGAEPRPLRVTEAELDSAVAGLDAKVRAGLERAIENVGTVARAGIRDDVTVGFDGHEVVLRSAPVRRAAVYVPGGRAPYPSTVVMGVVTARVAGVDHVAVCAPPRHDGDPDPVVLAACRLAGASAVYRMGGAQAVAALAYGTNTVPVVDVIVGPGNLYVQEAKRQVFGQVGIEGLAGPSDLVVIAEAGIDPGPLALDLLAQSEHGAGSLVVGISDSPGVLDVWQRALADAPGTGALAALVEVINIEEAVALAQAFAPEHLQLAGPKVEALAGEVTQAGCILVGEDSGTAFSDYIAGSNHVLPTGGTARFVSALSPAHFRRGFTVVRVGAGAGDLARVASPIARAEGFELHARSMEARIRDNG